MSISKVNQGMSSYFKVHLDQKNLPSLLNHLERQIAIGFWVKKYDLSNSKEIQKSIKDSLCQHYNLFANKAVNILEGLIVTGRFQRRSHRQAVRP